MLGAEKVVVCSRRVVELERHVADGVYPPVDDDGSDVVGFPVRAIDVKFSNDRQTKYRP